VVAADDDLAPGALDLVEYLMRTAPTVGEALAAVCAHAALLHPACTMEQEQQGDAVVLRVSIVADERWSADTVERVLRSLSQALRQSTGGRLTPREVRLQRAGSDHAQALQRALGCPVRLGAVQDALVFPCAALEWSQQSGDPTLHAVLRRQADDQLATVPGPRSVRDRVVREIRRGLANGQEVREGPLAQSLGVSPRTLRRRLREEGSSFARLLDDVRREVALGQLSGPRPPIAELASQLGFSGVPAFYRAFKRWTGRTPADFREHPHEPTSS
jgi:AraC-like DNA-binding protein